MSGLRLDSKEAALSGGYSGAVIKPGNSADSKLIHLVSGAIKDQIMPLGGQRLTPEQVGLLRAWIDQGARWPENNTPLAEPRRLATGSQSSGAGGAQEQTLAFIPPKRPAVPRVQTSAWVRILLMPLCWPGSNLKT